MCQSMIKSRKLFFLFLKSAKIKSPQKWHQRQKRENKQPQKKLFYSKLSGFRGNNFYLFIFLWLFGFYDNL